MKYYADSSIWEEKYRPQKLEDLILTDEMRSFIENCLEKKDIPNMLLYGRAGTGKSSLAHVIENELKADFLYLNGSSRSDRGISTLEPIMNFITTYSFREDSEVDFKVVFIDEAEKMTPDLQEALKVEIERTHKYARFILNTNNVHKLIDPLRSRFEQGSFNLVPDDKEARKKLVLDFRTRVFEILSAENVEFNKNSVMQLIVQKFPDFRRAIGALSRFVRIYPNEPIDDRVLNLGRGISKDLIDALKSKNIKKLRELATNMDASSFFREFDVTLYEHIEEEDDNITKATLILGKYAFENGITTAEPCTLKSCLTTLAMGVNFKKD